MGLGWMLLLTLVSITRQTVARPQLAWLLVAISLGWATMTVVENLRPGVRDPWWITLGDAALASAALASPDWVGTTELIYGGYPGITVAAAAVTERRRGWLVATVLSVVTLIRLQVSDLAGVLSGLSSLISYGMVAGIVGWAAHVIHSTDRDRREAEAAQARAEERAEVAAHLHDSVLQTLALIQREPEDASRVAMLARRQEQELRDWLYQPTLPTGLGLAEAIRAVVAEVDQTYRVPIEWVAVGDAPLTESTAALVAAGKEALVNAAKHAGAGAAVYLEAGPERARLYVRDRGAGFDPAGIAEDRHGIRQSIYERLQRVGGSVVVKSAPGQGTEVALEVPL